MPTTDCISPIELQFQRRPLVVTCDAPQVSSDGGVLILRQLDERMGLTKTLAALLEDPRDPGKRRHERLEQLRQRVYQICLGYEDCNDADQLRYDPMFQLASGAAQQTLSSQPTLSRFENGVRGRELNRLWRRFEQGYVDALDPASECIVLDIDGTDDPTHGAQQLSFFHGFYDQHMFHPLLVFDGDSGELITAMLRPGKVHAARGAATILARLIRAIKRRCPGAAIVVRGDSAFAMPRLMARLEALSDELGDVHYVLGLAKNSRLLAFAAPLLAEAAAQHATTKRFVRRFTWLSYAAETWSRERAVVLKVEHSERGDNPRFLVTTLDGFDPGLVYDRAFCPRGQSENFIKDFKNALSADRLSCHRFAANAFRLFLHAVAYRLMHALRRAAATVVPELGRLQMDTLRARLLKVAALAAQSARRILVRLPRVFPLANAFQRIARHLGAT
ncbi:MAG TPA: IS1380 family transposase [Gemmatimonadaceae bacterium]|nr:IS1380 family transposase [Gemmatimonadaceae bacterium]